MAGERTEVDITDELAALIRRVARGQSLDATDGDVLVRARLVINSLRIQLEDAKVKREERG